MSEFFEPPPPSVEPRRGPRLPPWVAPPSGTLPGVLELELVLARTERVAVCLTRVDAYQSGFEVDLLTMSSGEGDDELDPLLFARMAGPMGDRLRSRGTRVREGIPEQMLRFGVQFADGSKATNTSGGPPRPSGGPPGPRPPAGPAMHQRGGTGGGGSWRQGLWIWPLPPPGPLAFVCEWPAGGIPLTRHEIDAQQVLDAAARAQVVFPEDDWPPPAAGGSSVAYAAPPQASSN